MTSVVFADLIGSTGLFEKQIQPDGLGLIVPGCDRTDDNAPLITITVKADAMTP